jgi:hypothetical protein
MLLQANACSRKEHASGMRKTAPRLTPSLANNQILTLLRSLVISWPANQTPLPHTVHSVVVSSTSFSAILMHRKNILFQNID